MTTADSLAKTVQDSKVSFGLLMYDVPVETPHLYPVIARAIRNRALFVNLSCYLIQMAQRNQLEMSLKQAMEDAELECKKNNKPFKMVDYKILRFDPSESENLRQISAQELNKQVADIGKSLLASIERYEEKLNKKEYDIDTHITRFHAAVWKAKRDLDEARGLAMVFLIDKDVATAIDASTKILEAQAICLAKAKEEAKKLEEKAKKVEASEK